MHARRSPIRFRSLLAALALAAGLITPAAPVAAQGDTAAPPLPPRIEPEMQWTYEFGLDVSSRRQWQDAEGQPDGAPEESRNIQNATMTLRVESIDDQTGVATIVARFDRLTAVWRDSKRQYEAVWTRGDDNSRQPSNPLAELLAAFGASDLTLKVTPDGEVRGVDGLAAAAGALRRYPNLDRDVLGLFSLASATETFERIWRTPLPADGSTDEGFTWSTKSLIPIAPAIHGELHTDWTVDEKSDASTIVMNGESRVAFTLKPGQGGVPAYIRDLPEILDTEGSSAVTWDKALGCARSVRLTHAWDGRLKLDDLVLHETVKTQTSLSRVTPEPAGEAHP